ncbi:MAG TPA: amidohydrolase family protein [Anaerolineae bacterium]
MLFVAIAMLSTACLAAGETVEEAPSVGEVVDQPTITLREEINDEPNIPAAVTADEFPTEDEAAADELTVTTEEAAAELETSVDVSDDELPPESDAVPDEPAVTPEEAATEPALAAEDAPELPIFDTHVHYNEAAWSVFPPGEIIAKMERANVPRALVSSTPDDGTRLLYEEDPDRIVPFLRPYYEHVHSGNWFEDDTVVPYLTERLETPIYRGIGEIHLHFDGHADAPIVRQTARMAVEQGLYLHVHSNAEAVRTIFGYEPEVKIPWPHAGMSESPDVVSQMMDEHEQLWTDISIREYQIAPDGNLDPAWRDLFLAHPDRITIGSDTWVTSRWGQYEQIMTFDRSWLNQLPGDVAEQIAFGNAARLFGAGPHTEGE